MVQKDLIRCVPSIGTGDVTALMTKFVSKKDAVCSNMRRNFSIVSLEALLAQRRCPSSAMLPTARTQAGLPPIEDRVTSFIGNGANRLRDFPQSSAAVAPAIASERYESSEDIPTPKRRAVVDASRPDKAKTSNAKTSKGGRVREEDRWTSIPTASKAKVPNQGKGQVIPMSNRDDRANLTPYQAVIRESWSTSRRPRMMRQPRFKVVASQSC